MPLPSAPQHLTCREQEPILDVCKKYGVRRAEIQSLQVSCEEGVGRSHCRAVHRHVFTCSRLHLRGVANASSPWPGL